MLQINTQRVSVRKLWPSDTGLFRQHLKRLDTNARYMRFGGGVSDTFLDAYAQRACALDGIALGFFIEDELRGSGELRIIFDNWPVEAELAFAVEEPWQDRGIGRELLDRLITIAQNRSVKTLHMICLPENARMQHLAKQFDYKLITNISQVEGTLNPHWPTPVSLAREMWLDGSSFVRAMMRL